MGKNLNYAKDGKPEAAPVAGLGYNQRRLLDLINSGKRVMISELEKPGTSAYNSLSRSARLLLSRGLCSRSGRRLVANRTVSGGMWEAD